MKPSPPVSKNFDIIADRNRTIARTDLVRESAGPRPGTNNPEVPVLGSSEVPGTQY